MQCSQVFSELTWPGHDPIPGDGRPDFDDCATTATLQAVNVTSPWLHLPGVKAFRAAAGNPDDPNAGDGLTHTQVLAGIRNTYPQLRGHLKVMSGSAWSVLVGYVEEGRPVSIAVDSSKLAPRVPDFSFTGRHRICIAQPPRLADTGKVLYANPLARDRSPWLKVRLEDLRESIMTFGKLNVGQRGVWAVALPTDDEALEIRHQFTDDTPFDQADIDKVTADLQAKIDAALEALD